MADLDALYSYEGLPAIIPYAFSQTSPGYKYLCEKMKTTGSIWCVVDSEDEFPIVLTEPDKVFFKIFTNEDMGQHECDRLAMDRYYSKLVPLSLDTYASEIWKRFRDCGATHLRLDNAVWISIADLAPAATYDGFINVNAPLRNANLNSALYCYCQHVKADAASVKLAAYVWDIIKQAHFCLPILPIDPLKPGESLSSDNVQFHYIEQDNNRNALLVFTDENFLTIYKDALKLSQEDCGAFYTPSFESLRDIMVENEIDLCINLYAGSFLLTNELCAEFEQAALNAAARDASDKFSYDFADED